MADALSRNPLNGTFADLEPPNHADIARRTTNGELSMTRSDPIFKDIFSAAKADKEYNEVVTAFKKGINTKKLGNVNNLASNMKKIWEDVSLSDNEEHPLLLVNGNRVVLPQAQIGRIVDLVHLGHMGEAYTLQNAKSAFWWPHMRQDIENKLGKCEACQTTARSRLHEPPLDDGICLADLQPWDHVSLDFCELNGKYYLIAADRLTGFVLHKKTSGLSCSDAINTLAEWMYILGLPKYVWTDGAGGFAGEAFNKFCSERNIIHEQSSAGHASSNGIVEGAVGRVKRVIKRATLAGENPEIAIAEMRNCIAPNLRVSSADLFFKRPVRG